MGWSITRLCSREEIIVEWVRLVEEWTDWDQVGGGVDGLGSGWWRSGQTGVRLVEEWIDWDQVGGGVDRLGSCWWRSG